jgi:DNA-binding beta-propeller fold protein YncE
VRATTASGLAGSLDYLAPEQIRRDEVDGRTDQYALACVFYELLSGRPPFRRETEAQTLWAHMQDDSPALQGYEALEPVLARALAKERDERYESCGAFAEAARSALGLAPSPRTLRRRQRRLGRRLLAVGALLLAAAVLAIVAVMTRDGGGLQAAPNSVGILDPVSLALTATVPVGNTPTEIAVSDEWVWVVNANDGAGTISRIDAVTRQRRSTFSVAGTPRNILAAFGSLWVGTGEGRVYRVDPGTDLVEATWTLPNAGELSVFEVDPGAGWLAAGPNAVWAGSVRAISRIDPGSGRISPRASRVWGPMAFGFGSLWVLGEELERLSPATMAVEGTVELASGAVRVTAGLGSVWVTDEASAVLRVDPDEEGISRTYDVGGSPFGVAVGPDAVWATNEDGEVARIDPVTSAVTLIPVGGSPRGIDVGGRGVWVSVD